MRVSQLLQSLLQDEITATARQRYEAARAACTHTKNNKQQKHSREVRKTCVTATLSVLLLLQTLTVLLGATDTRFADARYAYPLLSCV